MREQIFVALLKALCKRTGLSCVSTDENCRAEWMLGVNRMVIQLNPDGSGITVRAYAMDTGTEIAGAEASILDEDAVVNGVCRVAEKLLAA